MSNGQPESHDPTPENLKHPDFLAFLQKLFPDGNLQPEWPDFDHDATPQTEAEQAQEYRRAQASRLARLYQEWHAVMYGTGGIGANQGRRFVRLGPPLKPEGS